MLTHCCIIRLLWIRTGEIHSTILVGSSENIMTSDSLLFQRITAEKLNTQLQFFGLALDGKMDLNGDGLTDIVVGSRGSVNIFRY